MTIRPGDRFGRYEIRAALGAGGMGEIFRAYDPRLDREVALKLIAADLEAHPQFRARFEQEARAASALNHPNIVTVHDLGEEQNKLFIVMELLEGNSLRQMVSSPLPLDVTLRLAAQVADALSAAHERGIVHRDLKPENIFVTRQGTAKILDFGLARMYQPAEEASVEQTLERLTKGAHVLGTVGYSAPEALSGSIVNRCADIFSFGAILYEMVCGVRPFRGSTAAEVFAATLRDEPSSASVHRSDLPGEVIRLISRCLAKDPSNRYSRTSDLRDDLRAMLAAGAESPKARPRSPLPAAKTELIGREEELRRITALIADDGVRLLTLTGPGGGGKTRLALAAAEALLPRFRGEVFFVPLATVTDPLRVPAAIAETLRVSLVPGQSALAAVIAEINTTGAPALLVLDNFEQVIEAAKDVSELLAACPVISVLVTSREVLHLYGEHDVAVPPLPVPDRDARLTAKELAEVPAVALFVERARAVDSTFRLTEDVTEAVAEICRRLDGLPLALELAAARVRMLPPRALLARLDQRLPLLTVRARDLPDRQLTLRRTIDWSYDLLTPAEQVLFLRLSVFVSGFTLEAAEAVADPFGKLGDALVDGLASLVDKSLLHKEEDDQSGELRFAMLETLREYATTLLSGTEDERPTRRAHAAYFLILAEEGARVLGNGESPDWLMRFAREHDNFRAALDYLAASGDSNWGLRMAVALFYFWERADHLIEGRRRLKTMIELPAAEGDDATRARAFHALGVFASTLGDSVDAAAQTEISLALHRRRGDESGVAVAHNALGIAFTDLREFERAAHHLEAALVSWQAVGNQSGYARSLSNLAFVRRMHGQHAETRRLHEEAAAIFDGLGDRLSSAWAVNHQGDVARDQQLWDDATKFYQAALQSFRALNDEWGAASSMADLGTVARHQSDVRAAEEWYRQALQSFSRLGHRRGIARVLESMAVLAAQVGSHERALTLAGAAAQLRVKLGAPGPITDQAELSRSIDSARNAVNNRAGEQAQRRGFAMSLAEAVRYAEA